MAPPMTARRRPSPYRRAACLALAVVGIGLAAVGCRTKEEAPTHLARFHLEADTALPSRWSRPVELPLSGTRLGIGPTPVLTEGDIANVELVRVDLGLCLLFQLTPEGAQTLGTLGLAHPGKRLVLLVNGQALGARVLLGSPPDGNWLTFVEVPEEELPDLAVALRDSARRLQERLRAAR